ncbi:MAG: HlyD family efflux transporter periplasmic adaptor subunit [Pleurocapsa sp. MO_192.B19]|nr:HlyD family efflux transporter periplasmic adaptor subunit [Pleurocapsa sp. MO_192.B19]
MLIEKLLIKTIENWDLERLIQDLIIIKSQQSNCTEFTNTEKIVLCGLLCSYDLQKIASFLPGEPYGLIINFNWRICGYLEQAVVMVLKSHNIKKRDILSLLAQAGYHKSKDINLDQSLDNDLSVKLEERVATATIIDCAREKTTTEAEIKLIPKRINCQIKDRQDLPNKSYQLPHNDNNIIVRKEVKSINYSPNGRGLAVDYGSLATNRESFPPVSRWTTIGGTVVMGLVGLTFALAATIKYDVTVKANGTVRPQGETKLVQASREGKIKSIQVIENQSIKRGDIIAYLDDVQLQDRVEQITTNLYQSQLQIERIDAQINNLERQNIAEIEKSDREIASAQIEYQQDRLKAQVQVEETTAELNIARQELAKAKIELQAVEADLKSTEAAFASARVKSDRYQKILTSGAISQEQFEEAQLAVQQQEQNLASKKAAVLEQKQSIKQQQQKIEVAEAKLFQAQADADPDNGVVEIARQALEREKANKEANIASNIREKEVLKQQRIETEKQIAKEKQQLQQLQQDSNNTILRATIDGTILKLNLRNQNQVINVGDTIAEIAPNSHKLVVKAQINPQDRDRIIIGQSVKLKIAACPYPDYGILAGKITTISADTISSQDDEQKYYIAKILPIAEILTKGEDSCQLRSGMETNADIIIKAETPLQFFLRQARLITDW